MEPVALLSGIGLGALGAKLLDIVWLQDKISLQQHAQWLKEKRLEAFSEVSKELISFGLHDEHRRGPFDSYATISKALLLIDDDSLIKRIDQFIVDMDRMNRMGEEKQRAEAEALYKVLVGEARDITALLRTLLLHGKV